MKYFYLSIKILFCIFLASCSSLDLAEEDTLIIITQDKETVLKKKIEEINQKPIKTIDNNKKNIESLSTEKKPLISKTKKAEKDEVKIVFDKIVKIGLLLPFSGEQKSLGKAMFNALEMALFETQSKNIKLIFRDSGDTEEKAISAARN